MARLAASVSLLLLGVVSPVVATGSTPNKPGSEVRNPFAMAYDPSFLEGYSPLKHIGGFGPYSNRRSYGIGRDPPAGCAVDQVHMIRRHGARYPMGSDTENMIASMTKMKSQVQTFKGDLAFFNTYQFYVDNMGDCGLETYSGPYNGLLMAYLNGADYRVRYGHLWNASDYSIIPMWSSENERVLQTARKFGEGFFGWNYTDIVAMNVVSESDSMGANSLTPNCPNDSGNAICNNLTNTFPIYQVAADRLMQQNPGLNITVNDISNLMETGAMELNVRGYSDWIDVFTLDEWIAYGYISALGYYWCHGPGDYKNIALGGIWANATLRLLNEGPDAVGSLFWSFTHDNNITPILAAFGISTPSEHLPVDHVKFPNEYNIGDIIPMGGHLTVERMTCNATAISPNDTYVRFILNEAVVPFSNCSDGPGYSCSLANLTEKLTAALPSFPMTCGLNASLPQDLTFYWDYNTTTTWDHQRSMYISYQGAPIS